MQEIFDSFKINFNNLHNIADNKTKRRINTYIEEWQDKGLLSGYFGSLAKSIYNRTRVKNSEILELIIYSAYIEEQSKLQKSELNIFKNVANHYYLEGQKEALDAQKKKKQPSIITDAIFLALLDMPNYSGFNWNQYINATIQYNANQIYRQAVINIQQQKELKIDSDEFQRLINQQNNQKLNINGGKISGAVDLELIGLNNLAKIEGIKSIDNNAKVRFIAVEDNVTTKMCDSLNNKIFYVSKENEFERYYGDTAKELKLKKFKVFGLILRYQHATYNSDIFIIAEAH